MCENVLNEMSEDEVSETSCVEVELRKKITDAQLFLERNKENVDPILYTELMFILERRTGMTLEELGEIYEKHR